ncbi:alpha/beta fold hydrolase [Pseudoalteromonas tunicata]|uniref:alpha/beta fold hydrolase n=1 Tax=Pseudoalteromonas tunicata TaxID=314281 RepID=UPI00273D95E0|nr:alpha/beta fold hydrolase [Pseudoalteromonas tunicata]MDP4982158.1 alpha/beta fold hydrolase [Pseudoalteromonas tunicata]
MTLHYQQFGAGADVIIIHGLFGSLENLNVISKALSNHYKVTAIDLRNHGQSPHNEQMSYAAMAGDIFALMDELDIKHAHFIGHSMGGKVAMQCALSVAEKVDKLIVLDIAPVTYQIRRHDNVFDGLFAVAEQQITDRKQADEILAQSINEAGVRQFLLKSLIKGENGYQWKFNHTVLKQEYANILSAPTGVAFDKPTLFLKGSESDYIDASQRPTFLSLFPKCQAKIIHGTGHWLHAEKPTAVNNAITAFLLG